MVGIFKLHKTMFLAKKYLNFIEKTLILALLVVVFEFCMPHVIYGQETGNSNELGPVLVQITNTNDTDLGDSIDKPRIIRWVTITAYSSTVDQCDDTPFIAASNKHVYDGMVACNFLPFGTKVKFPDVFGDKIFTVDDRMNKKYNSRIDIWMPTREQAKQFGAQYLKVEIY